MKTHTGIGDWIAANYELGTPFLQQVPRDCADYLLLNAQIREYDPGEIIINGKKVDEYFVDAINATVVAQPFAVTETVGKYNVLINVQGGGINGQAEACRHGISRALCEADKEAYRPALKAAGFLTRDARVKERKKYGLKKARKAPQFSKR